MTSSLRQRATSYLRDAAAGVRRAPAEVAVTLAVAVAFSAAIEFGDETMRSWMETAVAGLLILVIAWTGTLLHETGAWSARRRWAFTLGGALVVAIYAIVVLDLSYDAEAWRALLLAAAAGLWTIAMPALTQRGGDAVERMRRIDGRVVLRMIGALLYCLALFAGLALALAAVDSLFELELDGEIYGHVFGWIFFVLAPWIVLGGLPDYTRPAEAPSAVAGVAQRIALFLVPPLLGVYYVILYAYVVRILVTGELPKNLVSPMVFAAGALVLLALLLFDPRADGRPLSRTLRVAAPLYLPLAVLGVYAITVRLDQYGLTEFRVIRLVALVVLAALAVAGSIALLRRARMRLHWAAFALAATALLLAIGPWSALALSKRSQDAKLRASLEAVDIDPADETFRADTSTSAEPRVVPARHFEQIRSSARYLASHFGPDALPPALWHLAREEDHRWLDYALALGLRPDAPLDDQPMTRGGSLAYGVGVPISGGTAYRLTLNAVDPVRDTPPAATIIAGDSTRVTVRLPGRLLFADLAPILGSAFPDRGRGAPIPPAAAALPLVDETGTRVGDLLVEHVWLQQDSAGYRLNTIEATALVRDASPRPAER
ncbi:MAG TPA: DUF4153 domain-containing protein [Longimicrobiales bacterium]